MFCGQQNLTRLSIHTRVDRQWVYLHFWVKLYLRRSLYKSHSSRSKSHSLLERQWSHSSHIILSKVNKPRGYQGRRQRANTNKIKIHLEKQMSTKDSRRGDWQIRMNILEALGVFLPQKGDILYAHCLFQILFWVTARMALDASMLEKKKKQLSFQLFKAALLNTQPALIGQLAHAWASTMSIVGSVVFSAPSLLQF